jgi:hypothetical protein
MAYDPERLALLGRCYDDVVGQATVAGITVSLDLIAKIAERLMTASNAGETDPERLKSWALNAIDPSRYPAPTDQVNPLPNGRVVGAP